MTAPMDPHSDHPYSLGRRLTFKVHGRTCTASIKQVFNGCEDTQFTFSCTVLLECEPLLARFLQDISGFALKCGLVVIKVFDARYSEGLREEYYCFTDPECLDQDRELPPFSQEFNHSLPSCLLQTPTIKDYSECGILVPNATYGDVIKLVMREPMLQDDLIHEGVLTKHISEQDKEHYLQLISETLYNHECQVFKVAQTAGITLLPEFLATAQVTASHPTTTMSTMGLSTLCAPAILMEFMPGVSLRSLLATPVQDLDPERRLLLSRIACQTGSGLVEAIHTLMYHGLALMDTRVDNICINYSAQKDQVQLRLYDAGANFLVPTAHDCNFLCRTGEQAPDQACLLASTIPCFTLAYFCTDIEDRVQALINKYLLPYILPNETSIPLENLRITECFRTFKDTLDTICWQILMLCFWYFDDPTEAAQYTGRTLTKMRVANFILDYTKVQHTAKGGLTHYRYWVFVALARLCHRFSTYDCEEDIRRVAGTLFEHLHAIEQLGEQSLEEHYLLHQDMPYTIFRKCKPLQLRRQGTTKHFENSVAAIAKLDIMRIQDIVNEQHNLYPSRFFFSPLANPASDTSASTASDRSPISDEGWNNDSTFSKMIHVADESGRNVLNGDSVRYWSGKQHSTSLWEGDETGGGANVTL